MNLEEALPPDDRFTIVQNEMDWLRLPFWESIFSLSNGLIGMRGSFEEPMPGTRSRPMTFMAGLYDTLPAALPELPALPDWLTTRIVLGGSAFDLRLGQVKQFTRWLDMKCGLLRREVIWQDPRGRTTRLSFLRFASLADCSLSVLSVRVAPLDWSGQLELEADLTMPPVPAGRGRESSRSHFELAKSQSRADGTCWLATRTRQTRRPLVVAGAYEARTAGESIPGRAFILDVEPGQSCRLDRYMTFLADAPDAEPPTKKARHVAAAAWREGFDAQLDRHVAACQEMWNRIDVEIDGPAEDQRAIRFNLFQLATLCPRPGDFASIGPRGLTGTRYLGHIFWDAEIYMLPFFSLTNPQGARTLLTYRYRTLEGARRKAKANGYRGAQYAWESADTGDETCPRWLPDPQTGNPIRIWCGDLQDHITADVPYAIDQYLKATGDEAFLWDYAAEIFFETARFWASRVSRNDAGRADILDTMGPDEFHIHVHNDAYTNYLARWNLLAAADLYDNSAFPKAARQALIARLALTPDEPGTWREVAANLTLPHDEKTGLVNQSAGFTDRADVSPDILRMPRRVPIIDVIGPELTVEAQVLKQAEVVILQYLLENYFDKRSREVNFDYYEPRTSHDSSLSVSAHALAAARLGRIEQACDYLHRALYLDLDDLVGTTADGLHTANTGGVWLSLVFGFAGLSIEGDRPTATPRLPAAWRRLRFTLTHHGQRYTIDCTCDGARIERAP